MLGEGKRQVSENGGNWPQWRTDGEIVFSTAPSGTAVFAAPVNRIAAAFESGAPQRLPFPPAGVDKTPQSDGRRFLVEAPVDQPEPRRSINVVLNWPALLKR